MAGNDCDDAIAELYEFIDGELTPERRDAIRAHLDDCGPCLDAHDFEDALRRVLADKCRDTVPDALRDRIAHALEAEGS
ncbi:MAG: mycothiol system anti-sigma-R factor [Actinomycetota bacterium]